MQNLCLDPEFGRDPILRGLHGRGALQTDIKKEAAIYLITASFLSGATKNRTIRLSDYQSD